MSDEFQNDASELQEEAVEPAPENRAALYRQRAADLLDSITSRIKEVLAERGVTFDIFLLIPRSGDAIIMFGSTVEPDPSDDQWETVSELVTETVQEALGMDRAHARDIACAVIRQEA